MTGRRRSAADADGDSDGGVQEGSAAVEWSSGSKMIQRAEIFDEGWKGTGIECQVGHEDDRKEQRMQRRLLPALEW